MKRRHLLVVGARRARGSRHRPRRGQISRAHRSASSCRFAPAGPTDIIGRKVAEKMTALLGQNMIVDNKTGAAGSIGAIEVKNAKPDGYTLLFAPSSTHAINPTAFVKPAYDRGQGFHADLLDLRQSAGAGHASFDARFGDGPGRADEEEPRQVFLRLVGQRQHPSSRRRVLQTRGRRAWTSSTYPIAARARRCRTCCRARSSGCSRPSAPPCSSTAPASSASLAYAHAKRAAIAPEIPTMIEAGREGLRSLYLQSDPRAGRNAAAGDRHARPGVAQAHGRPRAS